MTNIQVKINDSWSNARDYQKFAYNKFIEQETRALSGLNEYKYNRNGIKFKIQRIIEGEEDNRNRNAYGAIYIIKEDDSKIAIINLDDIKVFLPDLTYTDGSNWHPARNYQKWAFVDYLYDSQYRKTYKSRDTPGRGTEIKLHGLQPHIKFSISKNANNSIYYERDNADRTRTRICNSEYGRQGYQGYFNRITSPIGISFVTPSTSSIPKLPDDLVEIETVDEEEQCCICYDIKQNIMFLPCKHINTCSKCFKHINKNICSICKQQIVKIEKI